MLNKKKLKNLSFPKLIRTFKDVQEISIMRSLMNQIIEEIEFSGKILDIGGGRKSNYIDIFKYVEYISVNIDKKIMPDVLIKENQKFPLEDNYFDGCLLFNVLEHIYDWEFIFKEIKRLLVKDGKVYIIIPFLYPIHGAPNDFKRVTGSYLEKFLKIKKFYDIQVFPISYGPMTNSNIVGYNNKYCRGFFCSISMIFDNFFRIILKKKLIKYSANNPLFYYVEATNLKE